MPSEVRDLKARKLGEHALQRGHVRNADVNMVRALRFRAVAEDEAIDCMARLNSLLLRGDVLADKNVEV